MQRIHRPHPRRREGGCFVLPLPRSEGSSAVLLLCSLSLCPLRLRHRLDYDCLFHLLPPRPSFLVVFSIPCCFSPLVDSLSITTGDHSPTPLSVKARNLVTLVVIGRSLSAMGRPVYCSYSTRVIVEQHKNVRMLCTRTDLYANCIRCYFGFREHWNNNHSVHVVWSRSHDFHDSSWLSRGGSCCCCRNPSNARFGSFWFMWFSIGSLQS